MAAIGVIKHVSAVHLSFYMIRITGLVWPVPFWDIAITRPTEMLFIPLPSFWQGLGQECSTGWAIDYDTMSILHILHCRGCICVKCSTGWAIDYDTMSILHILHCRGCICVKCLCVYVNFSCEACLNVI